MDVVYDVLGSAMENIFLFGVMFIVSLSIVIMVHEFGHYIAARICGVHVEQFAFGFGKEIIGFQKAGEYRTRFSLCLFPLGGFVKLFGDVDPDNPIVWDKVNERERRLSDDELARSFCTKNVWKRIFIVAAGPCINILLTILIITATFTIHGRASLPVVVTAIAQGSAAHEAGIKINDTILEMDGKPLRSLNDVYAITWNENPPEEHTYKIIRNGQEIQISYAANHVKYTSKKGIVTEHGQTGMVRMAALLFEDMLSIDGRPIDNKDKAKAFILQNFDKHLVIEVQYKEENTDHFQVLFPKRYNSHLTNIDPSKDDTFSDRVFLGNPEENLFVKLGVIEAFVTSFRIMQGIVVGTYKLISVAHKGKTDEPVLGGVMKISQHSADAVQGGIYTYLLFLAGFSFVIAFINLLPIPVLDGGYLVFLFYEVIARKSLPTRVQEIAMIIGLVILVGIMILGNVSDLISLLSSIQSD